MPTFFKFNNSVVSGVQWVRRDNTKPANTPTFKAGVEIIITFMRLSKQNFTFDGSWFGHPGPGLIDLYAGTPRLREALLKWSKLDGHDATDKVVQEFAEEARAFAKFREPFLLYM